MCKICVKYVVKICGRRVVHDLFRCTSGTVLSCMVMHANEYVRVLRVKLTFTEGYKKSLLQASFYEYVCLCMGVCMYIFVYIIHNFMISNFHQSIFVQLLFKLLHQDRKRLQEVNVLRKYGYLYNVSKCTVLFIANVYVDK